MAKRRKNIRYKYFKQLLSKLSIRILLTYASILIIPMFAIVMIYSTSINELLRYQEEQTMKGLENTAEVVQLRLEELYNIQSYIQSNPIINSIINNAHYRQEAERDIYLMKTALESFPSYELTNQMIQHTYIFFNDVGFTAKLPSGFVHNKQTYDANVKFKGISYDELNSLCTGRHVNKLYVAEDESGIDLLLLRSVVGSDTLIVTQINTKALSNVLDVNNTSDGSSIYILDSEHRFMAASGSQVFDNEDLCQIASEQVEGYKEILHDETIYLSYVYPYRGHTYISLTEKDYLLGEIASIRNAMVAISIVTSILGTLLVTLLWRRRHGTVLKVERTAESLGIFQEPAPSEQKLIEKTFSSISESMLQLRQQIVQQQAVLADTVLRKLVFGGYKNERDLKAEMEGTNLNLDENYYCLINVIPTSQTEESNNRSHLLPYRIVLKNYLEHRLPGSHLIFDLDNSSFIILLLLEQPISLALLKQQFNELTTEIEDKDWIPPSFVISENCDDILDTSKLMDQIDLMYEYLSCIDRAGVFTYGDLPQTDDVLYYPIEDELLFQRILKSGTSEELTEFWYKLLRENFTNRTLSVEMVMELRDRLRQSILRVLTSNLTEDEFKDLVESIHKTRSIQSLYHFAESTMFSLAKSTSKEQSEDIEDSRKKMQDIIEERLSDPSFSLHELAEQINMSESTLYRSFKTYFGVSFASYLEQSRITKAFELLRSQVAIKDVAKQVGYTSDHSFRRAFKRIMKVPPSEFQEGDL